MYVGFLWKITERKVMEEKLHDCTYCWISEKSLHSESEQEGENEGRWLEKMLFATAALQFPSLSQL